MKPADIIDKIVKARVSEYGIYVDLINELEEQVADLEDLGFGNEFIEGAKGALRCARNFAANETAWLRRCR